MIQHPFKPRSCFLAPVVLALLPSLSSCALAQAPADPDADNAPIADRETFDSKPKQTRQAPDLAAIGVPRTNYPIPRGALFASPQGKSNASGQNRSAPTTLQNAVASARTGGTVVLLGGDYHGVNALKIGRRLTLQAAPGETAWLKGSVVVSGFARDGARWSAAWNKKLTHPNKNDLDKALPLAGETDMVFVAGRSLAQVASLQDVKAGTFFVDVAARKLVLGDDPSGKIVEATVAETGLDIRNKVTAGTVIRGLGMAHFAAMGIEAYSQNLLVENNTFAWNAARGLRINGDDNVVRGNTFACNGMSGMHASHSQRFLFENNHVLFNNIENFRVTWAAAGTKMVNARDVTMRNNLYENNLAAAMWFDISCLKTNVVGNTVRHNKGLGVFYELCHDGIVAFNVLQDNGVGLMLSDSTQVRAWNNTFTDNAKAVVVKDTARVNVGKAEGSYKNAEALALGATWISAKNEFHNNIFAGARNEKTVFVDAGPVAGGKSSSTMIAALDNNVYARSAAGLPRLLVRWHGDGKPVDFSSLPSFRAANVRYEAGASVIQTSPFAAPDDFHLAPQSALLRAGAALPPDVVALATQAGIKLPANGARIGALGVAEGAK